MVFNELKYSSNSTEKIENQWVDNFNAFGDSNIKKLKINHIDNM